MQSSTENAKKENNMFKDCIPTNISTKFKWKKICKKNSFKYIVKKHKTRKIKST